MYHHRGAYLQALAMALHMGLDQRLRVPVDAADVPLQRLVLPVGGDRGRRHAPVPAASSSRRSIWRHMRESGVTHFCAAPTVLTMTIVGSGRSASCRGRCASATGGAPPTPALLERLAELGMDVTHLYGLTETFGPVGHLRMAQRVERAADRRAGAAQGAPGRRQRDRRADARRRRRRRRRPARRRDDGRDRDARQQRDARLLPRREATRRAVPTAGSAPATSA